MTPSAPRRIAQLINKTNQFNLTTRRYAQHEVDAVTADPRAIGLQLSLADRFGDNGVIAIVIGRMAGDEASLVLETWLMSCRVLGRRVEEATLAIIVEAAAGLGAERILGRYLPSEKNAMVADLFPRLGFTPLEDAGAEPGVTYALALKTYSAPDLPMTIVKD